MNSVPGKRFNIRTAPFIIMPADLIRDPAISPTAKTVYGVLMSYANQSEECWPSQALIAAAVGLTERRVRPYISELERAGWLTVKRRARQSAVYTLLQAQHIDRTQTSVHNLRPDVFGRDDRTQTSEELEPEELEAVGTNVPTAAMNGGMIAKLYVDAHRERLGFTPRDAVIMGAAASRHLRQGVPMKTLEQAAERCASDEYGARALDKHLRRLAGARDGTVERSSEDIFAGLGR